VGRTQRADRPGPRSPDPRRATASWIVVALAVVVCSSCSSSSRSAISTTTSTTNAATTTVTDAATTTTPTTIPATTTTIEAIPAPTSPPTTAPPAPIVTTTIAASVIPTPTVDNGAPASLDRISDLEALGDSVPFGTACNCTPYPQLAAAQVARITGHKVTGSNDAVAGFVSSDVLHQLRASPMATANVANADAVMIEIGANDIAFSSACGTNVSCYEAKLPQVVKNVTAIVARVRQLTAGHHVTIVLLDYWNVWLGGQVAQARGPAYVHAADAVTDAFSDAMQSIARSTGSLYVDLRAIFRGPDHDRDETSLLAGDGDHPDAAGQQRIADAIVHKVATA
jgi:acyl-CoA thioesterase I